MFWKAGLMDLAAGLIRTPLPPKETFLDDPLRVMRAIRFGARFGFKLEEELKNAASCEEVKEALGTKVSRERIGHEVINFLPVYEPLTNLTIRILPMCMTVRRCLFLNHLIVR
jgi:tRNA nucleotidyltransferase/poly(A) polymerase